MENSQARIIIFLVVLLTCLTLELFFEYRSRVLTRLSRWRGNFLLSFSSNLLLKLVAPIGLYGIVDWSIDHEFGLIRQLELEANIFLVFASVIFLDFTIYLQHILSHKIPLFWKLHRVHHSDPDLDGTSALRFHPLEILISFFYKALLVLVFGFSIESIFLFEVILSSMAIFNHSNIGLPLALEKKLRLFIVTPQMHIIHHSKERIEHDTNYGFNLSIWDRIFRTYQKEFHSNGLIGLNEFQMSFDQKFFRLLIQPFVK